MLVHHPSRSITEAEYAAEIHPTIETLGPEDWERVDEIVRKHRFVPIESGPRIEIPSDLEEECSLWESRTAR